MAKTKTVFYCTECGNETPKWQGRCPACGAWNTLEEHTEKPAAPGRAKSAPVGGSRRPQKLSQVDTEGEIRFSTGMGELDRVLGGGAVGGSLVLVGGAPGIGKSTLLLQICSCLCQGRKVLYVSGEESERQLKLRAQRLGVEPEGLYILSETQMTDILEAVNELQPDVLIADSIQTLYTDTNDSLPGSISQVKECTMILMNLAKAQGITVFVVGHINKDGNIAGPKVLEHMVDCVLYFEGDPNSSYRLLRAAKNRFGSTNEIGVFEMGDHGLIEVPNPSQMLLDGRPSG
ncbi:MAG: DNA repair protein RadA, partial [Clostridiales bacterium]|nr:DNA repair protein RadA [Clostridiales bacterium]